MHITTWMDLKGIMMSEISQSQKVTFIKHLSNDKIIEMGEEISGFQGLGMQKGKEEAAAIKG